MACCQPFCLHVGSYSKFLYAKLKTILMKKLLLILILSFVSGLVYAQPPTFRPMRTEFSYSRLGAEYKFYLYSEFAFGAGGGGPRVAAHLVEQSNDTVFIKALYNTGGVWLGSYSSSRDTIVYTNTDVATKYFNVSSNAYSKWDEFSSTDTAWNLFDSTFVTSPTGLTDIAGNGAVSVFPNPSGGNFTIAATTVFPAAAQGNGASVSATLYDMLGRVVHRQTLVFRNGNANLSLTIAPGSYLIGLKDQEGNSYHQRLLIR